MKQIIFTVAAISFAAGVGAAYLLTRSIKRTARKPPMTFWELYEDNQCSDSGLFDWAQVQSGRVQRGC